MKMSDLVPQRLLPGALDEKGEPRGLSKHVTNSLLSLSRRACAHPIHTIVAVLLIASTSYVRLLETSLFHDVGRPPSELDHVDSDSLLQAAKSLRLGEQTAWKWQSVSVDAAKEVRRERFDAAQSDF